MYPEPYYTDYEAWANEREDIIHSGFLVDKFLSEDPDCPVFGLNIALGWPLPDKIQGAYEKLCNELSAIDPGLYLYPFKTTHVTVMTLVDFTKHKNPQNTFIKGCGLLAKEIYRIVSEEVSSLKYSTGDTLVIDIGWPVLFKNAAILPILDNSNIIFKLRENIEARIKHLYNDNPCLSIKYPKNLIHSTILRFLKHPANHSEFVSKFESIAVKNKIGEVKINEFIITSETKPYMRDGEILYHLRLGEK